MSGAFYVMGCPKCGRWQACEVNDIREYTFKCRRDDCRATRKVKQSATFGIDIKKHGPYANASQAGAMVRALNKD